MKKLFKTSILFLFCCLQISAQELSKEYILKYKIKSITTTDSVKKQSTIKYFNEDGVILIEGLVYPTYMVFTRQYIYNGDKQLTEEKKITLAMDPDGSVYYHYDLNKRLVKKESFDSENSIEYTVAFEYDNNGKIVKENKKFANGEKLFSSFKYANDLLTEEEVVNEKKTIHKKMNYTYDKQNRTSEKKTLDLISKQSVLVNYVYNESGSLLSITEKSNEGTATTTYFYNEKGIIERSQKKSSSGEELKLYYQVEFFQ